MDFISDAEMERMSKQPADFISDEEMSKHSAPDFIPDTLVDQIPGLAPQVIPQEDTRGLLEKGWDAYKAANEVGLNLLTGGTTGMLGGAVNAAILGPIEDISRKIVGDVPSIQTAENRYLAGMEAGTYQPKSEQAKEVMEKYVSPLMQEMIPLAGLHGSLPSATHLGKVTQEIGKEPIAKPVSKTFDLVDPEFKTHLNTISEGERKILTDITAKQDTKIQEAQQFLKEAEDMIRTEEGINTSPDLIEGIDAMQGRLDKLLKDKVELEAKLAGREIIPEVIAVKVQALKDALAKDREPIPEPPVEPKVAPVEVALTKIGEAMQETPEKVQARMDDVLTKLDQLEEQRQTGMPGEEYNALRESLNREVDAYMEILEGKQPNLDWAQEQVKPIEAKPIDIIPEEEFKPVVIKNKVVPNAVEFQSSLTNKKTLGEAFTHIKEQELGTKGQKLLIDLLHKIPWVEKSTLSLTKIDKINEKGTKDLGNYNPRDNLIELHNGGNLQVLIHEAVHAATFHLLDQGTSPYAKKLIELYDKYNKIAGEQKTTRGTPFYGFTDVHEFVTEAFTKKEFQLLLDSIKSPGRSKIHSLWTDFKNTIKDLLGAKDKARTALDDVLNAGSQLMQVTAEKPDKFFQKLSDKGFKYDEKPASRVSDISIKAIDAMVSGTKKVGLEVFSKNKNAQFYRDHPEVQVAHTYIRRAEDIAEKISNQLWYGYVKKGSIKFIDTLDKVKKESSAYISLKNASNMDAYQVLKVFEKGFRKLDYETNLEQNGQHLTPKQVNLYRVLAKLEEDKYNQTVLLQNKLNKKNITHKVQGYFPAVREGQFHVEIGYGDVLSHVQYFSTKVAAERFRAKFGDVKHLQISEVLDKESVRSETNAQMIDIFVEAYGKAYPQQAAKAADVGAKILARMQERGGKMGMHQEYRSGLAGYKGSEMFMTPEELGHSFKNGVQSSMSDFANNVKALHIKTQVEPLITDPALKAKDPTGHEVIQQMFDSSLGRNKDYLKPVTDPMNHAINSLARDISQEVLGKEYTRDKGVMRSTQDGLTTLFYLTKMVPKFAFSVLGQILSIPQVTRHAAYGGHGMRANYSFVKGLTKLAAKDKDLYAALESDSQHYNTFEPGIIEQFDLVRKDQGKTMTAIKDWLLLQRPAKAMDSFSRVATYSILYTHYRDIGLTREAAMEQARWGTGDVQNLYDKSNQAPIYTHAGAIGDVVKPLQSYAQNYLGNLISDIQYFKAKDWNTWGPIVNFTLANVITGGVLSLPLIQEYETIRKLINAKFDDVTLPSILDLFARDDSFLDRIEPADEKDRNSILYGILSGQSGIDLAISVRANETYATVIAGVLAGQQTFDKLVPVIGGATSVVGGAYGVVKGLTGDMTVGEKKKAMSALMPAGHLAYLANELQGTNTTNVFGQPTDLKTVGTKGIADAPRTGLDIAAGLMGTKTIEQKKTDLRLQEQTNAEKLRAEKLDKMSILAVETGNLEKYVTKMADLGASEREIIGALQTAGFKRIIPQEITAIVNQQGKVSKGIKERNLLNRFKFQEK